MVSKTRRIVRVLSLAAILLLIMIQFTQTLGLAARGFDETDVLQQFFFYAAPGIGFLLGLLIVFVIELFITKGDARYGDSLAFNSPGEKPALSVFKRFTVMQIFLLSLIIFSMSGLVATVTNQQSFTGLAVLPQQFTATSSISFSTALVVVSENLGAAFVIAMLLLGLRALARKTNMSAINFSILAIMTFIVIGIVGLGNHLLRYPDSETALITVFVFWSVGGLITLLVGSFIPFAVMHASNNIFFDLQRFFSSDTVIGWTIGIIIGLILLYIVVYRKRLLGRKNVDG